VSLAPPDRTVIVVDRSHVPFVRSIQALDGFDHILYQPFDRGTAAGVLFGLQEIAAHDAEAIVLLTPSDHGVGSAREFETGIRRGLAAAQRDPSAVVLFGVRPTHPAADFGWITAVPGGRDLHRVAEFVEKPPPDVADRLFDADAVWNTMVLVARAAQLLDLYRRHLPELLSKFARSRNLAGAGRAASLAATYGDLTPWDFSKDLVGRASGLSLYIWPASMGWSDLGTPSRFRAWQRRRWPTPVLPACAVS
jgi:mannose-1-phosphate guanylyltransferase